MQQPGKVNFTKILMELPARSKVIVTAVADTPTRKGKYLRVEAGMSIAGYFVGTDPTSENPEEVFAEYVGP